MQLDVDRIVTIRIYHDIKLYFMLLLSLWLSSLNVYRWWCSWCWLYGRRSFYSHLMSWNLPQTEINIQSWFRSFPRYDDILMENTSFAIKNEFKGIQVYSVCIDWIMSLYRCVCSSSIRSFKIYSSWYVYSILSSRKTKNKSLQFSLFN